MASIDPWISTGETVYARLRRIARDARRANPHLLDSTTGAPGLLPAAQAPTVNTAAGYANAAAVVAAGFPQAFQAATTGVINQKLSYTGGWPIVYANSYVRLPCVTHGPSGAGNAQSNPPLDAFSSRCHFTTDAPQVVIGATTGASARFIVDGRYVSLTPTTWPTGTPSFVVLDFSSVGGRGRRQIVVEFIGSFNFFGVWLGATDTYEITSYSDRLRAVYFGDSISAGSNATYSGDCFAEVCSDYLGIVDTRRPSIGTTGYGVNGGNPLLYSAEQHVFDIVGQSPDIVFLTHNVNNISGGWATAQPYWQSVCAQIRGWSSSVPIFQIGVLNSATPSESYAIAATAYETAQQAFVNALAASDANLLYVPIILDPAGAWITGSGYTGNAVNDGNRQNFYDQAGPHPHTKGHQYVGMRMAAGVLAAIAGKA